MKGLAFAELERLDDEAATTLAHVRDRTLKDRLEHWRAALQAELI